MISLPLTLDVLCTVQMMSRQCAGDMTRRGWKALRQQSAVVEGHVQGGAGLDHEWLFEFPRMEFDNIWS